MPVRIIFTHTLESELSIEFYECEDCKKSFKTRKDLNRHINGIHLKFKPFQCCHCEAAFNRNEQLERHWKGKGSLGLV